MHKVIVASFLVVASLCSPAVAQADDFEIPGLGGQVWLGLGRPFGEGPNPEVGVTHPFFGMELHAQLSAAFLYVGGGYNWMRFDDADPSSVGVVNTESGAESDSETTASTEVYHFEGGVAHGFRAPDSSVGLRPSLGYGITTDGEVGRTVTNCNDCPWEVVQERYVGRSYVRLQLLGYFKPGAIAAGLGVSYQYFFQGDAAPGLTHAVMFNLAFGGGGGY